MRITMIPPMMQVRESDGTINPFRQDYYNMGVRLGTNCVVMLPNHDVAKCKYFIIVDTLSGERRHVEMTDSVEPILENIENLPNRDVENREQVAKELRELVFTVFGDEESLSDEINDRINMLCMATWILYYTPNPKLWMVCTIMNELNRIVSE